MKRQRPDSSEFDRFIDYFLERLNPRTGMAQQNNSLDLSKGSDYYARKELNQVDTPEALVSWSRKWISDEHWRRARDSVRSHRYKDRNALSRINVQTSTKQVLMERASAHGLPLWRYLLCLQLTTEQLEFLETEAGLSRTSE